MQKTTKTTMRQTHYQMGFQAIKFSRLRSVLEFRKKKELDKYHNRCIRDVHILYDLKMSLLY